MDNLVLESLKEGRLCQRYTPNSFAIDQDSGLAYFAGNNQIFRLELSTLNFNELEDRSITKDLPTNPLIYSTFLHEDKFYFLLYNDGKIIILDTMAEEFCELQLELDAYDTDYHNGTEAEGKTQQNTDEIMIESARFSNDEECLVVCTTRNRVLIFSRGFSLQNAYNLNKLDYGQNEFINVNWGSKETQFHGTGMRDHRTVKEEFYPLSESDDRQSTIAWREDDNYFVINNVCPTKQCRHLKIFNRYGVLQHTSESIPGLEKHICWRSINSGGLIATSVRTPNKHSIVFVEKNGLRHGEFELEKHSNEYRFDVEEILSSLSADVLLVRGKIFKNNIALKQEIRLFTQSNYYWYCKQNLQFSLANTNSVQENTLQQDSNSNESVGSNNETDQIDFIENIHWNSSAHCGIFYITRKGAFANKVYAKKVSSTNDNHVLVIDNRTVNVSMFENNLVPPPMCNYSLTFVDACVTNILTSISPASTADNSEQIPTRFAVSTRNDCLFVFEFRRIATIQELQASQGYSDRSVEYKFHNVPANFGDHVPVLLSKTSVNGISDMVLGTLFTDGKLLGMINDKIVYFDCCSGNPPEASKFVSLASLCKSIHVTDIEFWFPYDSERMLCYSRTVSSLFLYNFIRHEFEAHSIPAWDGKQTNLIAGIEKMFVFDDGDSNSKNILILTKHNCLFLNGTRILPDAFVTSMSVYNNTYLLFISNDAFYCYPLSNLESNLENYSQRYPARILERGSRFISQSNKDAKVVLQMPRGNLEQFHPRILIMDQVKKCLRTGDYLRAFEMLRRNRIDLNCLCDYDFNDWINNCKVFVEQIPVDWLCLFLTDLSDNQSDFFDENRKPIPNKTNTVCEIISKIMKQVDEKKYRNPILLSFIRKSPTRIDSALELIASLDNNHERDKALDFMLYSVKPDKLFDEAFGTYNFDILLMATAKCGRDPKEAVALTNEFNAIPDDNYRKAKIDLYLRKFERALENLSKCDNKYEEMLQLICDRNLYLEAIRLFDLNRSAHNSDKHPQIWNCYGEYLLKKKYHQEAGIVFKRARNWVSAMKMFMISGDVQRALECAENLPETEAERSYSSIAAQFAGNGDQATAGWIFETYLHDFRGAFEHFLLGHKWIDAIRCLARLQKQYQQKGKDSITNEDLREELNKELVSAYDIYRASLQAYREEMSSHLQRLNELKATRIASRNVDPSGDFLEPDMDSYSDTSSIADSVTSEGSTTSRASLRTNKSSASRKRKVKKQEQKKYQLKRGSPNEDLQIIYAIKELIANVGRLLEGTDSLALALFEQFFTEHSQQLRLDVEQIVCEISKTIDAIWGEELWTARIAEDQLLRDVPKIPMTTNQSAALDGQNDAGNTTPVNGTVDKWTIALNSLM